MKRQIRNAITSLVVMAFAGVGLIAFGQNPTQTSPAQPVAQPTVIQQTVEQTCTQPQQPVVQQTVQDYIVQPVATAAPAAPCVDLCELVRDIEKTADHLRHEFKDSVRCLDCADDSYYDSVKEFERATDRLKRNFRRDCDACDVAGDVQEVLALANCISAYMDPCSHCPEVIAEWTELQGELQALAGQFCTTASFQQPISLACPVPCVQPTCVQPTCAQPTCAQPTYAQPAPVVAPCPTSGVIYK